MRSFIILAASLAFLSAPTQLVAQAPVTGQNVTVVNHAYGAFRQEKPKRWTEIGAQGGRFAFVEEKRDATSVTLYDASRKYRIILDLKQRQILLDSTGYELKPLYVITGVSAGQAAAPAAAAPSGGRTLDAKKQSAQIAYTVSQKSPLLPAASRTAISQDFNGAPLAGKPAVHSVTATAVSCRARNQKPEGTAATCNITYNQGAAASLTGEDATDLFVALGKAGVQDDGSAGHMTRAITDLFCTVDDKMAQESPGNDLRGFSCKFTTE